MNEKKPQILVVNDDGIHAPGLKALAESLRSLGDVWIIAPDRERSGVSHSFTMYQPIRAQKVGDQTYIIDGTPTDCVMFGTRGFLENPPDLVAAGINNGPNLGIDTVYSGTVAAAHEGHLSGVPSFAISMDVPLQRDFYHFETAARFAPMIAKKILEHKLPAGCFLNINVPNLPWEELQGVAVTRLGQRVYHDRVIRRTDPQGKEYFWIGGEKPTWIQAEGTDFHALEEKKISVTPLGQDFTQFHAIPELDKWGVQLSSEETKDSG
ncbi:MAG: 5'/3'-nucleotidase SurE [bacterium]